MFSSSKGKSKDYRDQDVDALTVNAYTPVRQTAIPSSSISHVDSIALVHETPVHAATLGLPGMMSSLSQFWSSPTLHEEVDRVSNQKTGSAVHDLGQTPINNDSGETEKIESSREKRKKIEINIRYDRDGIKKSGNIRSCIGSSSE